MDLRDKINLALIFLNVLIALYIKNYYAFIGWVGFSILFYELNKKK